ncbi:hypothetical protein [Agromyces italicus]|uniref:hypothetical protein n=1 Tax=Agromyces italicus TaxID=279572 RepID=UPI0003B70A27|nr:hypothetical protein [Agromyces italicus]
MRAVDPVAAAAATMPWPKKLSLLVSVLAAASAFALYFSRAQLDIEAVIPLAAVLVIVAALLYAVAVLPVRRELPPPPNTVVGGWIPAGLAGATTFAIGQLISTTPTRNSSAGASGRLIACRCPGRA